MSTKSQELKKELKAAFPGVKFSVTSDHSSIRVRYEDGPARQDVEAVSNSYRNVRYCESSGEILSGGNTFVFVERSISADLKAVFTKELLSLGYSQADINSRHDYHVEQAYGGLCRTYDALKMLDTAVLDIEDPVQSEEAPTPKQVATHRKPRAKTAGLSVVQEGVEVRENKEKNGIEIRISSPDSVAIATLQSHGFRKSRTHGCWYAPLRDDTKAFAYSLQVG